MSKIFEFSNFFIEIKYKSIKQESLDKIFTPKEFNSQGKPIEFEKKFREREVVEFKLLGVILDNTYSTMTNDIFVAIQFQELCKSFVGNRLDPEKSYRVGRSNCKIVSRTVEVEKDNKKVRQFSLRVDIGDEYLYFFDKFECATIAAQLGKILGKCEAI